MEARHRARRYLLGGDVDRPPFVAFATDLTARLAQTTPPALFADPQILTQSFMEAVAVCKLECVVLALPAEAVRTAVAGEPEAPELAATREAIVRLRTLLGGRAALVLALPGPLELAATMGRASDNDELDDIVAALLRLIQSLHPPDLDVVAVVEREVPAGDEDMLGSALASLWNSAHYYSMPGLLVVASGGELMARSRADAVAVWDGADPATLLTAGARRVGVPVPPSAFLPEGGELPRLPAGGFFVSRGEIPAEAEVARVRTVAELATRPLPGGA